MNGSDQLPRPLHEPHLSLHCEMRDVTTQHEELKGRGNGSSSFRDAADESGRQERDPEVNTAEAAASVLTTTPFVDGDALPSTTCPRDSGDGCPLEGCRDHFTLSAPSSTMRCRTSASVVRVYQGRYSQFVIQSDVPEPDGQGGGGGDVSSSVLTVRRTTDGNPSVRMLRAAYGLVCLFFAAVLLVFCLEVILFLAIDVTKEVLHWQEMNLPARGRFVGTVLALPVLLCGSASAMVMAGLFAADAWGGSSLVMKLLRFGRDRVHSTVVAEWLTFCVYIGIPLVVLIGTLFSRLENWWEITSLAWFSCVGAFYIIFVAALSLYETAMCFQLMASRKELKGKNTGRVLADIILCRQRYKYSGNKSTAKLVRGEIASLSLSTRQYKAEGKERTLKGASFLWFRFSQWKFLRSREQGGRLGLFQQLDEPRWYPGSVEDLNGARPFLTSQSWSLEKIFCHPPRSSYAAIIRGPGALSREMLRSSFACTILGYTLILLVVVSGLIWMGLGWVAIVVVSALAFVFFILPMMLRTWSIYHITRDVSRLKTEMFSHDEKRGDVVDHSQARHASSLHNLEAVDKDAASEAVFQVYQTFRHSQATRRLCWIMFVIELTLLYLWPLVTIFVNGATQLGIVFFMVGVFTGIRHYLNASTVLEEKGTFDIVDESAKDSSNDPDLKKTEQVEQQMWKNRSLLNDIIANVSRSRCQSLWIAILAGCSLLFFAVALMAVEQQETSTYELYQNDYIPDFYYAKQSELAYPSCQVGAGFVLGEGTDADVLENRLLDYTFLAGLAYSHETIVKHQLDGWFGEGVAVDRVDLVSEHIDEYISRGNRKSPVSYKLIVFPSVPDFGVITIRGTFTRLDLLADAKLWMAALFMQLIRAVVPFGEMWTPILHRLVKIIGALESASIENVAYYRQTSDFVSFANKTEELRRIRVTGHSLGGGIAIITGAQMDIQAIALSGPNSMISRETYNPPVSIEALSTRTFNIIPDRDIFPMIDDRAPLYQKIDCTASASDFFLCHDFYRSLCEIMVKCGTGDRPALCLCHLNYGYPKPVSRNGNRTFVEACGTDPIDFFNFE